MMVLLVISVCLVPAVLSAAEYTQTLVEFNILSNLAYVVTLPGIANVTSDPTASSAATAMIYFNTTSGDDKAVNPRPIGGNIQESGTPIFEFDNVGTQNVTIALYLNDTTPACIKLLGKTTWSAVADGAAVIALTNTTVISNMGPWVAAQDYYLWTNFTSCGPAQYYRILYSTGYN